MPFWYPTTLFGRNSRLGPEKNDFFTDLAVRVGDVATAAKMRIMASLQRSAAEPVDTGFCFRAWGV